MAESASSASSSLEGKIGTTIVQRAPSSPAISGRIPIPFQPNYPKARGLVGGGIIGGGGSRKWTNWREKRFGNILRWEFIFKITLGVGMKKRAESNFGGKPVSKNGEYR